MPSGSRGGSSGRSGGGGSHFSGGGSRFSGGRGSSGSGARGSHFGHSMGPRMFRGRPGMMHGRPVFFIGRRHYMPATAMNKISLMIFGLFFILFFSLFAGVFTFVYSQNLKIIKADYVYYQDMIADAEANPELQETGIITAIKRNESVDKWYLEYVFVADDGEENPGYTYSIYTWEQAKDFVRGGEILLAVDSLHTTRGSDSVNMDYKNFSLEDDAEYVKIKRFKTVAIVVDVLIAVGFVSLLVATIISFKKQLQEKDAEEAEKKAQEEKENAVLHCAYCGAVIAKDKETCSKCGAANLNKG